VLFEGKGLFRPKYSKSSEYPIDQINEVYADVQYPQCYLIKTKEGEQWQWSLNVPSTTVGIEATMATRQGITTRWVNAINRLLRP
jgi:hypothetical protein